MRTGRLFIRELCFRPGGFVLGIMAVAAAAACVVGARGFLAAHDAETDRLVSELETRAKDRMAAMRNDARVFSKSLGFNILLLPAGQDPADLYATDRSTVFFSREEVKTLGEAEFHTLNHLLPMLRHRTRWEAFGGDVVLIGAEGELYIKAPTFQKPIQESIQPGVVHIGDAIRRRMKLKSGDSIDLLGKAFTIGRLLPQEGNIDDISILMNLGDLQEITGQPDRIGGVLALSCSCAAGNLAPIRMEAARIIPDIQVVEFSVRARARQRARDAINQRTRAELEDIRGSRAALRAGIVRFASLLVLLVTVGAVVVVGALTLWSARERRTELAMLRALGLGAGRILVLFLAKAALSGAAGGMLGCLAGLGAGHLFLGPAATAPMAFMAVVIGATALIAVAGAGLPALLAARTDPATILNRE